MIPPFDDSGSLPPSIHPVTLNGIDARFGRSSELRRVQLAADRAGAPKGVVEVIP